MTRTFDLYVQDMLTAVARIREYTASLDYDAFVRNTMAMDAVIRNLVAIGEAAAGMPPDIREAAPHIPWNKLKGLRNIAVHTYWSVDAPTIWDVVSNKLDGLEAGLRSLLRDPGRTAP